MNGGLAYRRAGNRVAYAAPHGVYPAAGNDEWVAIACLDDAQWRSLARACGHQEWADESRFASVEVRKAHEDTLDALIAAYTREQDAAPLMERLQAAGVPAGVAQRASDVLADPHLVERGYFAYLDHAEAGRRAYDGPPFRLSKTRAELRAAAPLLGEHTFEIATDLLGLTADEVGTLVAEGVLG
jgi:benzylsuccinate CoA-transferase BbsF subunit